MKKSILSIVLALLLLSSCTSLKPYEKQYINDPEMQMDSDAGQNFNNYVHSIREAATPAESSKGSGGCGCN